MKAPGWERPARLDSLGDDYKAEVLLEVIAGKRLHLPRKRQTVSAPEKANLLIDIQAKLRAGKGAGFAKWASSQNLKQMAQTISFLSEHKLLNYADLSEKAAAATQRYNGLSAQFKTAEKCMAENAALQTHIANYSKTREVYAAYRKAGYSKKFLAEHEGHILLHKAAKKAFDELGVTKLPSIKSLQAEYAALMDEKKKAYSEYRQARDEMRELLTHKANVERLLEIDTEAQKKAERGKEESR